MNDRAKKLIYKYAAPLFFVLRAAAAGKLKRALSPKMAPREKIIFAKRLAILIRAGVPIITALDILKRQSISKGAKRIIGHLRSRVERGESLAVSMDGFRNVFGNFGINIVMVGEISGTLAQNLDYLSDELKKKQALRRAVTGALVYPAFIVAATIGIVVFLVAYVFPRILPVFSSFRADLPWSTKALIFASNALQNYWAHFLAGFFLLAIAFALLARAEKFRRAGARFILRLPFLGALFRSYFIANFTRTFSLLLKSEIGIIQALKIAGDTCGSAAYGESFKKIIAGVIRGGSVAEGMENDMLLYPPLVSQMIGVGEMTGNLESNLMYLSEMYEDEMNNLTKNLTTSIEPALMIFMGLLVGFVAISIITPIYGITQNLRG